MRRQILVALAGVLGVTLVGALLGWTRAQPKQERMILFKHEVQNLDALERAGWELEAIKAHVEAPAVEYVRNALARLGLYRIDDSGVPTGTPAVYVFSRRV